MDILLCLASLTTNQVEARKLKARELKLKLPWGCLAQKRGKLYQLPGLLHRKHHKHGSFPRFLLRIHKYSVVVMAPSAWTVWRGSSPTHPGSS